MARKKTPSWVQKNYPDWKKNLWGAFRAFTGSFIATMGIFLITAQPEDFSCWENAKKFLVPLALSSFTAGVVALGKFLRDLYPDSEVIQKIPI